MWLGQLPNVRTILLDGNNFDYPDDESALQQLVRVSEPGDGLHWPPPQSRTAFGSQGSVDTFFMVRVDDPTRCLKCEGVMIAVGALSARARR